MSVVHLGGRYNVGFVSTRSPKLSNKVVPAGDAATSISDDMTVGVRGFIPSEYPKKVNLALADQVLHGRRCKINLRSGASVGLAIEEALATLLYGDPGR